MKKKTVTLLCAAFTAAMLLGGCGNTQVNEMTEVAPEPVVEETQDTAEEEAAEEPAEEEPANEDTQEENEAADTSDDNMIENGDFSEGLGVWQTYLNNGEADLAVNDEGQLEIRIKNAGDLDYSVQAYYDGISIDQGVKYLIAFDCAVSKPRTVVWRVQVNGGDYHAYFTDEFKATEEMEHHEYEVTMEEESDPAPRFCFNVGSYEGDGDLGEHVVTIDNLVMKVLDESGKVAAGGVEQADILVNQVGFLPGEKKTVTFRGDAIGSDFEVVDTDGNSVGSYKQSDAKDNSGTQESCSRGDFTDLKTAGTYQIKVGDELSAPFTIGDDALDELLKETTYLMHMQRCGVELTKEEGGDYAHAACHTEKAKVLDTGEMIDVTGGWHDAGDYGRYIVPAAKAAGDLMLAAEDYPSVMGDVLDEVSYELDWMLKMQREDGGVYHKVSCANFPGTVFPDEETEELIVCPVSNAATADFAACLAMAGRVYEKNDANRAKTYLDASKKAFEYLKAHQNEGGFHNPDGIVTGEYPDEDWKDDYFWSAAELYRTTGDDAYLSVMKELGIDHVSEGMGWDCNGFYAAYALLSKNPDDELSKTVLAKVEAAADSFVAAAEKDAYGSSIVDDNYPWGSNMSVANHGMLMHMLMKLGLSDSAKLEKYKSAATDQLSYLLGQNGTGYCFVTGFGTLSTKKPHHRPSQAVGTAVKGMLAGGPNVGREDPYAQNALKDKAPALCYVDADQSYSTNEIAIYWNSPLVYLIAAEKAEK